MALWGNNDNVGSAGTVSLNYDTRVVTGTGTSFGIDGEGASEGDVIRFGIRGLGVYFGDLNRWYRLLHIRHYCVTMGLVV